MQLEILYLQAMSDKIIIAIDGPAGAGKSTTAKLVAERLGYTYIDTGAMYRAVTLLALRNGFLSKREALIVALKNVDLQLKYEMGDITVLLNEEDVSQAIRSKKVNDFVSEISKISEVRRELILKQKEIGKSGGVVMEGRDIGTVVFPEADLKVFLTAALETRINRRVGDFKRTGSFVTDEEVKENLQKRDELDSTRDVSPLQKPEGAFEIDTSSLTIEEQVSMIVEKAKEIIKNKSYR